MSKKGKRRHADYDRFVGLPHWMLRSLAWAGREGDDDAGVVAVDPLPANAKALLLAVWQRFSGFNNGEIGYSVREAARLGLHRNRATEAFAELIARGFLRIASDSTFDQKRLARTWTI